MKYKKKIQNTKFNRLVELNFICWSQACFFFWSERTSSWLEFFLGGDEHM